MSLDAGYHDSRGVLGAADGKRATAEQIALICPRDSAPLANADPSRYQCTACGREYPVEDGVVRFLEEDDAFYEGAYENHVAFLPRSERPWHIWPLWLVNSGYPWAVRRHVPAHSVVVELGCAGGVSYFGRRYRMIGCDLSYQSLRRSRHVYGALLQVDASACIVLPDGAVDAVVSSYFWEHIPPSLKPKILAECARILKPGGKLVFLYDVATENPLIAHYRLRRPELYRRLFIEGDGHFGYQKPDENLRLFREAGFEVLERRGMEKTPLQSPAAYTKLAEFDGLGPRAFGWAKWLGRKPLFYPYTALMRLTDTVVDPLLPKDWARIELVVCAKRDS